jgi:hypothetical protein
MTGPLNVDALKAVVIERWREGGMETLVKVMPKGSRPSPEHVIGYCTSIKFVVGRTPLEMEAILGFAAGTKLALGAEIYMVRPLPTAMQFELRGYTQLPGGVPVTPAHPVDRRYPPGLGAPQWELTGYPQSGLHYIATVIPGERFSCRISNLPVPV